MKDEIKISYLKSEVERLRGLCLRAAEEIESLNEELVKISDYSDELKKELDDFGCFYSVNLMSRLTGRIRGHYTGYDTSKWYDCALCDAGYPDQECTCLKVL